ncbi:MAG: aminotransferase class IV [Chlamydiota bacterium]
MIAYINGEFVDGPKASIALGDLGLLRGYGGFECLRTYHGKLFLFQEHLRRLQNSLEKLLIPLQLDADLLEKVTYELISLNNLEEAFVKIIVTGGLSADHITPSTPNVIVMAYPPYPFPKNYYETGIRAITFSTYKRDFPNIKSLHYASAVIGMQKAREQGANEALYQNPDGTILEGTLSNFFAFIGDHLVTPNQGILQGITRQTVLKIAEKEFPIQYRSPHLEELEGQEAFVTSVSKKILPINAIDNTPLRCVGKYTAHLMALFDKEIEKSVACSACCSAAKTV